MIHRPPSPITGLRVAVTGGTSGLGLALVTALRERGAAVAFVARHEDRVAEVARLHPGSHGIAGDVSDRAFHLPGVFELLAKDPNSKARRGRLTTAHGVIETPAFMPVGTQGTVKAVSPHELRELQAQIILGNTYHLFVRPGIEVIRHADL